MGILDLVSAILAREILWVPVLLLLFNQILKVAFSLLKLLSNTLKEVALTVGAELCAVGISIHVAVMAKSDSAFGRYFPANRQAAAGAILLVIYFVLTCVSLMFLKFAHNEMHTTISDQSKQVWHVVKTGLFIGLSVAFGAFLFILVVSTS